MKTTVLLLLPVLVFLSACGGLTEGEAKTKLNSLVEEQSIIACDCINALGSLQEDALIEETAKCKSTGQSELNRVANDQGIQSDFPEVYKDAKQKYTDNVDQCN